MARGLQNRHSASPLPETGTGTTIVFAKFQIEALVLIKVNDDL
jgi:hypothetical protein